MAKKSKSRGAAKRPKRTFKVPARALKPRPAAARKPRGPRSQGLPMEGLDQVRNVRLDHFAESIGEDRDVINQKRQEVLASTQGALQEMVKAGVQVYQHAGVEFAVIPGDAKLRVRRIKGGVSEAAGDRSDDGIEASDLPGEGAEA